MSLLLRRIELGCGLSYFEALEVQYSDRIVEEMEGAGGRGMIDGLEHC
jgi:hypothetical protein